MCIYIYVYKMFKMYKNIGNFNEIVQECRNIVKYLKVDFRSK